jgi:hypothetical protein
MRAAKRAGKGRVVTAADDRATALADPSGSYVASGRRPDSDRLGS